MTVGLVSVHCLYGVVYKCLLSVCIQVFTVFLYGVVYKCLLTVEGCVQAFADCMGLCISVCGLFVGCYVQVFVDCLYGVCVQVFASYAGSTDWRGEPDGPAI